MAINHGMRDGIWIQRLLNKLLPEQAIRKIEIVGDNKTSLGLMKDPESQNRTKHIDVIHYYVRELVDNKELGIA